MTRAERKRLTEWLIDGHPCIFFLLIVWCFTFWIIPALIGGWLVWALLLPFLVGPFFLGWGLNSAILRLRVRGGGAVTYEYSLERVEDREKAVQRREDAVRELEWRTRNA